MQPKERIRASAVVVSNDRLLTVLLEDPLTKVIRHFLPGGAVEKGESPAEAALRETLEETGIVIELLSQPPVIARYPFTWNGQVYDCTTSFFAGTCDIPKVNPVINDAVYNKGVAWIAMKDIEELLGFDRHICNATMAVLRSAFNAG